MFQVRIIRSAFRHLLAPLLTFLSVTSVCAAPLMLASPKSRRGKSLRRKELRDPI
jgi:energy-converting hydrogenase Eha subunit E